MTTKLTSFLCLSLLMGSVVYAGSGDVAVIRSIRYSVQEGTGRLAVGTEGIPVVVARRHGDVATLAFPHATVSSPPGAARVDFPDGPMRSAVIERSGTDSITVFIRLRHGGNIDVGLEGHDVVFRVIPAGPKQAPPQTPGKKAAAVSRSPIAVETAATTLAGAPHLRPEREAPAEKNGASLSFGMVMVLLGLLVLSALLSFAVALLVVRALQRKPQPAAIPPAPVEAAHPATPSVEPEEESMVEAEVPRMVLSGDDEEQEDEGDEREYQLAKAFRRGKGEMDLVRRMEGKQDVQFGTKINDSCHTARTKAQRVQNAKRLGVGRGEIDLALRLKDLIPAMNSEEEES